MSDSDTQAGLADLRRRVTELEQRAAWLALPTPSELKAASHEALQAGRDRLHDEVVLLTSTLHHASERLELVTRERDACLEACRAAVRWYTEEHAAPVAALGAAMTATKAAISLCERGKEHQP